MDTTIKTLTALLVINLAVPGAAAAQGSEDDRDALVALYEATDGTNWNNSRYWLSDEWIALWYGVHIPLGSDRVASLSLSENNLTGQIPGTALTQLTKLVGLHLSRNNLTGPIPAELGQLDNLRGLALDDNDLTGPIPAELGQLDNLESLLLSNNNLTGPIPAILGQLDNLETLALIGNNLTGPIPAILGQLDNLTGLWLSNNNLTGPIPAALGQLDNFWFLHLNGNNLSGPIPVELAQLTDLVNDDGLRLDADTGLCLPANFPDSKFLVLARDQGVPACTGETEPPRPVQQTREECMDDAGVAGRGTGGAWDDNVGPCVALPTEEIESTGSLIEACRLCVAEWDAASTESRVAAYASIEFLTYMLNCIVPKIRQAESQGIKLAAAIMVVAAVVGGAGVAAAAGGFIVIMKLARALGYSPAEVVARFIRNALAETEGSGLRPFAGSQHPSDGEWVKVQSTNPDALAFSFDDNGDLLFHYNRAEPAEFVWTLMEGDTPVGSVVLPYVPGPPPMVVPVLPLSAVVGLGVMLTLIAVRFRQRVETSRR